LWEMDSLATHVTERLAELNTILEGRSNDKT